MTMYLDSEVIIDKTEIGTKREGERETEKD
jgi:hypothetical protein